MFIFIINNFFEQTLDETHIPNINKCTFLVKFLSPLMLKLCGQL